VRVSRWSPSTTVEIAKKIDIHKSYVAGIAHLQKNGEECLIAAVEKGRIPLSVVMQIANADEDGIQQALCQAYKDKSLRGRELFAVPRIAVRFSNLDKRGRQLNRPMQQHLIS
jgi:ParB family chromosome partitioning protein